MKASSPSGYNTIPTAASPPPPAPAAATAPAPSSAVSRASELVTRFKEEGHALIAARRPWGELLERRAFASPLNTGEAATRLRRNFSYFRANYAIVVLLAVFVSLIWHPSSLITFVALFAVWFFLYFSRDMPLVLFGRTIDDGTVLTVLSVATVVALVITDVASNILAPIMIGLAVVGIHAVFRTTDDLFLDEQEAASGGLFPVVGTPVVRQA